MAAVTGPMPIQPTRPDIDPSNPYSGAARDLRQGAKFAAERVEGGRETSPLPVLSEAQAAHRGLRGRDRADHAAVTAGLSLRERREEVPVAVLGEVLDGLRKLDGTPAPEPGAAPAPGPAPAPQPARQPRGRHHAPAGHAPAPEPPPAAPRAPGDDPAFRDELAWLYRAEGARLLGRGFWEAGARERAERAMRLAGRIEACRSRTELAQLLLELTEDGRSISD